MNDDDHTSSNEYIFKTKFYKQPYQGDIKLRGKNNEQNKINNNDLWNDGIIFKRDGVHFD